jgi:hypothetical protein
MKVEGEGERSSRRIIMCATAALGDNASNRAGWGGCLSFFVDLFSLFASQHIQDSVQRVVSSSKPVSHFVITTGATQKTKSSSRKNNST